MISKLGFVELVAYNFSIESGGKFTMIMFWNFVLNKCECVALEAH